MDRGPRQRRRRLGPAPNPKRGNGFSLLELVVVIGVLVTIGFITMPMLFQFIKYATYTASKQVLYGARKECLISTGMHQLLEMNGVIFSTSNPQDTCNSVVTAAFDDGCSISLDLRTGEKSNAGQNGWPNTYEDCINQQNSNLIIAKQPDVVAVTQNQTESTSSSEGKNEQGAQESDEEAGENNEALEASFLEGEGSYTDQRINDMVYIDVDGDGINEIISVGRLGTRLHYLEEGVWKSKVLPGGDASSGAMTKGDINGDGLEDIAFVGRNGAIGYSFNKGDGSWSTQYIGGDPLSGLNDIELADIDGDGRLEVLVSGDYDNSVTIYNESTQTGEWVPQKVTSSQDQVGMFRVTTADLDNDGKLEIIAGGDDIWVFKQDSSDSWQNTQTLDMGVLTGNGFEVRDIDNDGNQDILANSGNSIQWHKNNGPGNQFTQAKLADLPTFDDGRTEWGTTTANFKDLDSDGDLDMVTINSGENSISWYENTGTESSPRFGDKQLLIKQFGAPTSLLMEDFDGDGLIDIAGGAYYGKGGNEDNRRLLVFKNEPN